MKTLPLPSLDDTFATHSMTGQRNIARRFARIAIMQKTAKLAHNAPASIPCLAANFQQPENSMKTPEDHKVLAFVLLPLLLAACGGGGGSADTSPADRLSELGKPQNNAATQAAFEQSKIGTRAIDRQLDHSRLIINGTVVQELGNGYQRRDYRILPAGFTTTPSRLEFPENGKTFDLTTRSYQGFHSGIFINYNNQTGNAAGTSLYGAETRAIDRPVSGKAVYQGSAFDRTEQGTLTYNVDFAAGQGEGKIEGLSHYGTITLNPGKFQISPTWGLEIYSSANSSRGHALQYGAEFFGPKLEEMAGSVSNAAENDDIGFHGARGSIAW